MLPADDPAFGDHLARRRAEACRCNVNILGEAIVGDDEARARLDAVLERLRPARRRLRLGEDLGDLCGHQHAGVRAHGRSDRRPPRVALRRRGGVRPAGVREPRHGGVPRPRTDGGGVPAGARRAPVRAPRCRHRAPGLPARRARGRPLDLGDWAADDVGGAADAPRCASSREPTWPWRRSRPSCAGGSRRRSVPRPTSTPTTRRCSTSSPTRRSTTRVDIGVGSHNLFDVAWALGMRDRMLAAGRRDRLGIEMLEGMAPSQSEAVRAVAGDLVLYAPIVQRGDFPSRARLPGPPARREHRTGELPVAAVRSRRRPGADSNGKPTLFRAAVAASTPARPSSAPATASSDAPDAVPSGRPVRQRCRHRLDPPGEPGVDRRAHLRSPAGCTSRDWRSPPTTSTRAVRTARDAQAPWWDLGADERSRLLHAVADSFEHDRGRILATMAHEAGKTVPEGDPEVSEAIDFARYYADDGRRLAGIDGAPTGSARHGPRRLTVELPVRHPRRGSAGGARGGQRRDPQAGTPVGATRAALIVELCVEAGFPATSCSSCRHPTATSAGASSPIHSSTPSCSPDRWRRRRCSSSGDPHSASTARRAGRTRWSSAPPPTSTTRWPTSSGRRSATPGRSVRRPAWRSSRPRSTTTRRFLERLRDAAATLAGRSRHRSRHRRRTADRAARDRCSRVR